MVTPKCELSVAAARPNPIRRGGELRSSACAASTVSAPETSARSRLLRRGSRAPLTTARRVSASSDVRGSAYSSAPAMEHEQLLSQLLRHTMPPFARSHPKGCLEDAAEVGHIRETPSIGNLADCPMSLQGITQSRLTPRQAQRTNKSRNRCLPMCQDGIRVSDADACALRHSGRVKARIRKARFDRLAHLL